MFGAVTDIVDVIVVLAATGSVSSAARDVTELREAAIASEWSAAAVVRAIAAIPTQDADRRITSRNRGAAQLHGDTEGEV